MKVPELARPPRAQGLVVTSALAEQAMARPELS